MTTNSDTRAVLDSLDLGRIATEIQPFVGWGIGIAIGNGNHKPWVIQRTATLIDIATISCGVCGDNSLELSFADFGRVSIVDADLSRIEVERDLSGGAADVMWVFHLGCELEVRIAPQFPAPEESEES